MSVSAPQKPRFVDLLRPGSRTAMLLIGLVVGLILAGYAVTRAGLPFWGGTLIALGVVAVPFGMRNIDIAERYGVAASVLVTLLALQAFHTVEHIVQIVQVYVLDKPGILAQGLISSLNVEWVHFIWNWIVWGALVYLLRQGLRGAWAYALFGWVTAHSLEHTYMLLTYLHTSAELGMLGLPQFGAAQVLPGILGKDGWLANNLMFCRDLLIGTLPRVTIHFWWNIGEMALLLLATKQSFHALLPKTKH